MTGWIQPWRPRVARTAAAAAIGLGSLPAIGLASDPSAPYVLPGTTMTALTADIDDDGAREVVRLTDERGATIVEAWDVVDGSWAPTFAADIDGLVPDRAEQGGEPTPAALARARVDGTDRVLVLIAGFDPTQGMPGCCLSIHELAGSERGVELRALSLPQVTTDSTVLVDVDGDGTDELATTYIRWDDDGNAGTTSVALLRREDEGWTIAGSWEADGQWYVMFPADTDGRPGLELLASGETGEVVRLSWVDGGLTEERSDVTFDGQQGWINGETGDSLLLALPNAVGLLAWPSGQEPSLVATHPSRDYPTIGVLGSGSDALFVVQDHDGSGAPQSTVQILDADLQPVGEVTMSPEAQWLWARIERLYRDGWHSSRNIWPYTGPAAGAWTGEEPSYLVGGMLLTAGPSGSFEVRQSRTLVMQPVGVAGPDDGWVALVDGYIVSGPVAHLAYGWFGAQNRLALAPAAALLETAERELLTEVRLEGAIETGRTDEATSLLLAPTGGEIVVTVAPDTVIISSDGATATDHGTRDRTVRLEVAPPRRPPRDRPAEFEREVMLIGPEGNVAFHRWEGTFAPEAPELTSWSRVEPLSLQATVAGRTMPGSTVTVDGKTVELNEFGAYRAEVSAPPWPRNITVVARDPFGGEQRTTVEVIGLVDYRGLPWVPIAGAATAVGGAVLYLRTPKHRPLPERRAPDDEPLDDGRLEDVDGDLI